MNSASTTRSDRREMLRSSCTGLNGIDYALTGADCITLHFFHPLNEQISPRQILVRDKRRWSELPVTRLEIDDNQIIVRVEDPQLDIPYLVEVTTVDPDGDRSSCAPAWIDPRNRSIDAVFHGGSCRANEADASGGPPRSPITTSDPLPCVAADEPIRNDPELSYLARDYESFRKLIFDRLSQIMPDWRETHAADVQVAMIEVMAFAADRISYYQDAVATEAYLETARQRISVRRHARLVDYRMHEGSNARAFVHLQVSSDDTFASDEIQLITAPPALFQQTATVLTASEIPDALLDHVVVFEPIPPHRRGPELQVNDLIDPCRTASTVVQHRRDILRAIWRRLTKPVQQELKRSHKSASPLSESAIKYCPVDQPLHSRR